MTLLRFTTSNEEKQVAIYKQGKLATPILKRSSAPNGLLYKWKERRKSKPILMNQHQGQEMNSIESEERLVIELK